jgi:hypothetical protein
VDDIADMAPDAERTLAERALRRRYGLVRLRTGTLLAGSDRSHVTRFAVADGPDALPETIIVKRTLGMGKADDVPSRPDSPTVRFLNEWSSLTFLGEIASDPPIAPRLYGDDRVEGVLVLEDVGDVTTLGGSLLGDDPVVAETDLIAWATTLGRLHARTASQVDRFREIRNAFGWLNPGFGSAWLAPTIHAMLDAADVAPVAGLDADVATVEAAFTDPRDFAVLIHADPCPGNWVRSGSSNRLLDFEYSGVGHALLDGAYARMPFPTCGDTGRLPDEVIRKLETAYRSELGAGCPAARDDDRYHRAIAEACAFWLLLLCHWFPLADLLRNDRPWGRATMRQRLVIRLEVAAKSADKAGHLEALGQVAKTLAVKLDSRWDGVVEPLSLYPAFEAS